MTVQIIAKIECRIKNNKSFKKIKRYHDGEKRLAYHKAGHALLNVYLNEEDTYNNIPSLSLIHTGDNEYIQMSTIL